jgi:hypothetical protein
MDEVKVEQEYSFRRRWLALTFVSVLSGILAASSLLSALEGNRTMVLWFAIFGATFALSAFFWWKRSRTPRRRIAFTESGLLLPDGWWKGEEKFVAFSDITGLTFVRLVGVASGQVMVLKLCTLHDLFRIAAEDFAEGHFHGICDLLLDRVRRELADSVAPSFWLRVCSKSPKRPLWAYVL